MNQSFEQCSLFLHPKKYSSLDMPLFVSELKNIELISNAIKIRDNHFYTGEKFLDYVVYMGCAPNIQFKESSDNKKFCFIKIHHHNQNQLIVSKTQIKSPQCPECKKPIKNWQDKVTDTTLFCEHCDTTANIENCNWRKMGGFSNLFIEITDIFPKEAIPQQLLLDKLSKITQTDWLYFYSCH
jgi:hypothetical protein